MGWTRTLDLIVLELSCRNPPVEEHIEILICPAFRLRHSEIRPDEAQPAQPAEEITELALQVGFIGVDQIGDRYCHDNTYHGLHGRSYGDCLRSDTRGGTFTEDNEGDGTNREIVDAVPDQHQGALGPFDSRRSAGNRVENSDDEHEDHANCEADIKDATSAEDVDEVP